MQDAPYLPADLHRQIQVDCIYTVHYFEYTKHYRYAGEAHDFWECVYVDRGEVIATAGTENITLGRGEILFHPPNEWHTLRANGVVAPNLVVLSFASRSPLMESFRGRHMRPGNRGRALISAILRESESVFATPLGDPRTKHMQKKHPAVVPPGAEQLILTYLEELLILLLREENTRPVSVLRHRESGDLFTLLCNFMQENIGRRLSLADLSHRAGVSESTIKALFRSRTGGGALAYFIRRKTDAAKILIREGNYNLSQISDLLGYESIHYFSRQFRAVTGMSPSEYARSVRAMEEDSGTEDSDPENTVDFPV